MNKEFDFSGEVKKKEEPLPSLNRQDFLAAKSPAYIDLVVLMISRTSRLIGEGDADVEDIVQDALLIGRDHVENKKTDNNFPEDDSVPRYVLKILNNSTKDYFRKQKRRERIAGISSSLDKEQELIPGTELTEEVVLAESGASELLKILGQVIPNERLREAWLLFELHGYSYKEIAELQQVSLGTVRSGINRVRNKIARSVSLFEENYQT